MKKCKKYMPKFLRRFILGQKYKRQQDGAPKRSKKAHNPLIVFLNFIFMLAALGIIAATAALYSVKSVYQRPGPAAAEQDVQIPAGFGVAAIGSLLESRGLIASARIFAYGLYLEDNAGRLKAGEYKIPPHASMQEIADIIIRGRSVQFSITLPEGMTVAQIFAKLREAPLLSGDLPAELPPEGSLMTDTVSFNRGTSRQEIIRRLSVGQARLVNEIWAGRDPDLPLQSPQQMVILASIVEKETGLAAERPRVAAVFYNRLKKHMRLQSDPTILYGLFGSAGRPADRPIYRSDLERETAYNTYKIFGLPPTPICNPGRDSLLAVAHPAQTEDLYFVADGTGGHIFAASLSEHNNNVAKWRALRKMREQAAAQPEQGSATAPNAPAVKQTAPAEAAAKAATPDSAGLAAKAPDNNAAPADKNPGRQPETGGSLPALKLMEKDSSFSPPGSGMIKETP